MNIAAAPKLAVAETAISTGTFPADNDAAGYMFNQTELVSDIMIAAGVITITARNTECDGGEPIFVLTPSTTAGAVEWDCSATQGQNCAPASCRAAAAN
ncbi:MAG: pilin [Xanthomonadaceae bacterium]|nr:pilin [Xanthomonadaceae bacterium]